MAKERTLKSKFGNKYKRKKKYEKLPEFIWEDIYTKYRTGEYTLRDLEKLYGVHYTLIGQRLRNKNIKVNEKAKEAIELLDKGFNAINDLFYVEQDKEKEQEMKELSQRINGKRSDDDQKEYNEMSMALVVPDDKKKADDALKVEVIDQENSIRLANEIIELVAKKNPQFARGVQSLGSLMIKRAEEILQSEKGVSSMDIKNIANAIKDIDSTMSIFPKQPTIAQQFNFGNKQSEKKVDTDIKLNINVIGRKKDDNKD